LGPGGSLAVSRRSSVNDRGWQRRRQQPRQVKLVGDRVRGRIVLVDVKETNGHAGNGWVEAVV
jgi:hypothetical protein